MNDLPQYRFIENANLLHNNKYIYGVYSGIDKQMCIYCPDHGWFDQIAEGHLNGMGCAKCTPASNTPKGGVEGGV